MKVVVAGGRACRFALCTEMYGVEAALVSQGDHTSQIRRPIE